MADALKRISPLSHREPIAVDGLSLSELPYLGKLILRTERKPAQAKFKKALGATLPDPGRSTASEQVDILWLAPDEWLIITGIDEAVSVRTKLGRALGGLHHQLADVSDYYTVISLTGHHARDVLAACTTLDLHPSKFAAGDVAGSNFAHAVGILHLSQEEPEASGPTFHLAVRWSFADYLWCTIAAGAREFGVPEQHPIDGERLVIPG
jgi:sarcosine oxidase subunit gamma